MVQDKLLATYPRVKQFLEFMPWQKHEITQ